MTYKIVITKTAQKEVLEAVKYISDELKSHQSALDLFNYAYSKRAEVKNRHKVY